VCTDWLPTITRVDGGDGRFIWKVSLYTSTRLNGITSQKIVVKCICYRTEMGHSILNWMRQQQGQVSKQDFFFSVPYKWDSGLIFTQQSVISPQLHSPVNVCGLKDFLVVSPIIFHAGDLHQPSVCILICLDTSNKLCRKHNLFKAIFGVWWALDMQYPPSPPKEEIFE
jgi:hypothetical protein